MKEKIKGFLRSAECKAAAVASVVAAGLAGAASATETSNSVVSSLQTGFTSMKTDALSAIGMIIPIALSIAAAIFIARKAIGWFKSLAK